MSFLIAEVIVDVSTYHVDRPFDYQVPLEWVNVIELGCRVKVPFGPRNVLGFIVGLKKETDVPLNKLKAITQILDMEPVLTEEMLLMAKWLKNNTICYEIDALQVMLPSALRAKYEKIIKLQQSQSLPEEVQYIFGKRQQANFKEFERAGLLPLLKQLVAESIVSIENVVKQQGNVKEIRMVQITEDQQLVEQALEQSKRAVKQRLLLQWMCQHLGEILSPQHICEETGVSISVLEAVIEKGAAQFIQEEVFRDPFTKKVSRTQALQLTEEQRGALQAITTAIEQQQAQTFLLHGVTGSGKTEVYLQAIQKVLDEGKEAIMLVPEISLTPQMTERFRSRFGEMVAVMHSGLSVGEKYDEWRKIQQGKVKVVVGARSAIFAPFTNIGLIILDEEHESTYKQEDSPRYHARDVAIWRSEFYKCPIILGSATPALESFARAKKGVYTLLSLTQRALHQALPTVFIADMREELRQGNRSMFSDSLAEAIRIRLEKKEQMVLFLNRRGYSSFVLCRDCGTVVQCPNCDISLTYHRTTEKLKCHYCGYEESVPKICPQCQSDHIRYFGTGTQKVEEELFKLFPEARVLRMDVDTTKHKGAHEEILDTFGAGHADILLGTQMIAKGLDFPNITLVGVLSADTSLHLPDYRAAERTFQLLTQVSGRAGRHDKPGEVIIQTYTPEHYAIELAKTQEYEPFYEREMFLRRRSSYPPYYFVALIQLSHEDVMMAAEYAGRVADWLRGNLSNQVAIIGPTTASIARLQNRYRYQCLIKYKIEPNLIPVLQRLLAMYRAEWIKQGILMTVDLDPSTI
ncbi:MAG TPA: primosomal protein N' [Lysinibacillus sp.]|jgi:primosomal protein N' (replication factor Y)|uniref:Replication restart protein PriA n=1 Tax=Lysinibacillus fusiformis TaxID=28031 RepID=A0A2I0V4S8_9BACI|nr:MULTISPECIES: primosomal protein N' [Lysinibacillus]HBT71127.1 primosomal protein N' [Lysinibacillus sp.]KUF36410.1 primosomal protein N' [Lysinibacillus sp. F5]PKU53327.1 primosomal protein N' [Lysinibacillus fusiformis]WCH48716.1 primosomal protein N' [Lysinibacillus sp. OF-1]SCX81572.1 replication restart DNA helicase PriA [Lysinibacillus sp. SG9]